MADGNGEVALRFGISDVSLSAVQFEALDTKLGGIDGAINKLAENIAEPDTSVAAEIVMLRESVSAELTTVNQSITTLNTTILEASNNLGKWLAAIALAAANPADNTAEVQRLIDEQAAKLDSDATAITEAINQANQPKES